MHAPIAAALLLATLAPSGRAQTAPAQPDLTAGFQSPPTSARPHTWWHWMNGNITKEGITADLEAMKQIGLGGAQMFNVSESIPDGPILYMSPEWRALVQHAAAEADRLGLELCMHNCAGWSSSGGPWITPENAMQIVTTSETTVFGPKHVDEPLAQPPTKLDFYRDIAVLAYPLIRPAEGQNAGIPGIAFKAGFDIRYDQQPDLATFPANVTIARDKIIDLTPHLKNGRLTWDAPAGEWTILRFGYTPTGAVNAPSPVSGRGLEVDKLSRSAFDTHWAGMMGPVLADLGPLAGKTLNNALIDSYEVGPQNWTPAFRAEFQKRRGYDPIPFLPVVAGRIIDCGEVSERFLWDFRRTIADLFADNYFSYFAELCHKNGLEASIEPYDGPFECLLAGRDADIPMGEFWIGGGETVSVRLAASVAHTYGKTLVGAEAFTAAPNAGRWQNYPANLKAIGDLIYCEGVNRFIIHRYAHQPWMDQSPGMTMGQWGTHFERTTTWWNQGKAWAQYLARCQFLLQQGRFVGDALLFAGEAAPNSAPYAPDLKAAGYDYDACNADILLNHASVSDGRIVLTSGMSYRVLVLPNSTFMTPQLLTKLRDLVRAGATVIGPRPTKSPSLAAFPACDAQVEKLAAELWGDANGTTITEHRLGAGRVIWGPTVETVLSSLTTPDAEFAPASPGPTPNIAWIHRRTGDADIYFLSNQKPRSEEVLCTLRVRGRIPELFHADTGLVEDAPIWTERKSGTTIPIRFDPSGSVFIVFRRDAGTSDHLTAIRAPDSPSPDTKPPVIAIKQAAYEAVDGSGGVDVTAQVAKMAAKGQWSIPASNSLFGDPTYNHVKRLRIEFTLDGKPLTMTADENTAIDLVAPAPDRPASFTLSRDSQGRPELHAFAPGAYEFQTASSKTIKKQVPHLPGPLNISGPWTVKFQPRRGAPPSITLDTLSSLSDHADPAVRYFSGTAEYTTSFTLPPDFVASDHVFTLDLGNVAVIAEVKLNGDDLGTWWKFPFAADITAAAQPGANTLTVRITNTWANRLIGDEQLPQDIEWNGMPIARWPDWLTNHQVRKSGRQTFTTWHHYTKDSPLPTSGLIGPVILRPGQRITIE